MKILEEIVDALLTFFPWVFLLVMLLISGIYFVDPFIQRASPAFENEPIIGIVVAMALLTIWIGGLIKIAEFLDNIIKRLKGDQ